MAATDPKVNGYDRFGWVDMLRFIHTVVSTPKDGLYDL
jgi:hypothetical protein